MTSKKNQVKFWGNDYKSMNLPRNVVSVIYHSEFFHNELFRLKSFNEVIREIDKTVKVIYSNNPQTPSKCVMFVYKLHIMKMTKKQMTAMINHNNSYIKAMAMIYCRFAIPPESQIQYYKLLIEDTSLINFRGDRKMTISEFIKLIVLQKKFIGILAPRIPRKQSEEIEEFVKKNSVRKRSRSTHKERNEHNRNFDKRRKLDNEYRSKKKRVRFSEEEQQPRGKSTNRKENRDHSPVESRFSRPPPVPSNVVLSNSLYGEDSYESSASSSRTGATNRLLSLLRKK